MKWDLPRLFLLCFSQIVLILSGRVDTPSFYSQMPFFTRRTEKAKYTAVSSSAAVTKVKFTSSFFKRSFPLIVFKLPPFPGFSVKEAFAPVILKILFEGTYNHVIISYRRYIPKDPLFVRKIVSNSSFLCFSIIPAQNAEIALQGQERISVTRFCVIYIFSSLRQ